jgi:hypothetical protein
MPPIVQIIGRKTPGMSSQFGPIVRIRFGPTSSGGEPYPDGVADWDPYGPPVANVLQLRVSLDEFEPTVWRRVLVLESISLTKVHRVIQELMLWWDYHLHLLTINGVEFG